METEMREALDRNMRVEIQMFDDALRICLNRDDGEVTEILMRPAVAVQFALAVASAALQIDRELYDTFMNETEALTKETVN